LVCGVFHYSSRHNHIQNVANQSNIEILHLHVKIKQMCLNSDETKGIGFDYICPPTRTAKVVISGQTEGEA
jgi:hypothetical protein